MSRQIRYGYSYSGSTQINFDSSEGAQTIKLETQNLSTASGTSASSSAILFNAKNSPFIVLKRSQVTLVIMLIKVPFVLITVD